MQLALAPVEELCGVVQRDGEPLAGVDVVLEAPNRTHAMFAAFGIGSRETRRQVLKHPAPAVQRVRTDAAGKFAFGSFETVASERHLTVTDARGVRLAHGIVRRGEREIDVGCDRTVSRTER